MRLGNVLTLKDIAAGYGQRMAIEEISFSIQKAELVTLVGPNGAGKSTLLKTISGICASRRGELWLEDESLSTLPSFIRARMGIATSLQGHRVFGELTVAENLSVSSFAGTKSERASNVQAVLSLIPLLGQRRNQMAGTLSGGTKQLLSIACCLVAAPKVVLLDEPTLGLPESAAENIFRVIQTVHRELQFALLIAEHRIRLSASVSDRVIGISKGTLHFDVPAQELLVDNGRINALYAAL